MWLFCEFCEQTISDKSLLKRIRRVINNILNAKMSLSLLNYRYQRQRIQQRYMSQYGRYAGRRSLWQTRLWRIQNVVERRQKVEGEQNLRFSYNRSVWKISECNLEPSGKHGIATTIQLVQRCNVCKNFRRCSNYTIETNRDVWAHSNCDKHWIARDTVWTITFWTSWFIVTVPRMARLISTIISCARSELKQWSVSTIVLIPLYIFRLIYVCILYCKLLHKYIDLWF